MYATAHRVISPLEEQGVNAFLHLHGPGFAWPTDPEPLADNHPGTLVERATEVPPGGNRVRSYLDVLAPDGTGRSEIADAVRALGEALDGKANPTWFEMGRVTLRFGVEPAIEKKGLAPRAAELHALAAAVDKLLARRLS